jgi:hypothetical protein
MSIMNKSFLAAAALLSIIFSSCSKKENPIDNSNTIKVPYVLYFGTDVNNIYKTNDAVSYSTIKYGAGSFTQSIYSLDTNILFFNDKAHVANGMQLQFPVPFRTELGFSPLLLNGNKTILGYINSTCFDAGQKKMYACAIAPVPTLYESNKNGAYGSWIVSPFTTTANSIRSVTATPDGNVYCMSDNLILYKRAGGVGNFTIVPFGASKFSTGNNEVYFLSHHNNQLILSDASGKSGAFYSNDLGVNWFKIANSDKGRFLMGKDVAYSGEYYTSKDSMGLFKLVGNALVPDNAGVPTYARIYDIVGKRNVYRTDVSKYYFFLGTNKGLFKSDNGMKDWYKLANNPEIVDAEITALY